MPKAKTATSNAPTVVAKATTTPVPRCRLDLGCDRTTTGLRLHRITRDGSTAPTLSCPACAQAAGFGGGQ